MKEIQLSQGKVALVDDEDFEFLSQWKWYAINKKLGYYAIRGVWLFGQNTSIRVYMHRLILKVTDPKIFVDHKDHNSLNNQRYNLRTATHSQNMMNRQSEKNSTSKYLGVSWCATYKKWVASIGINGKKKTIGRFNNETDAAIAYNKLAIETHREFANLNTV